MSPLEAPPAKTKEERIAEKKAAKKAAKKAEIKAMKAAAKAEAKTQVSQERGLVTDSQAISIDEMLPAPGHQTTTTTAHAAPTTTLHHTSHTEVKHQTALGHKTEQVAGAKVGGAVDKLAGLAGHKKNVTSTMTTNTTTAVTSHGHSTNHGMLNVLNVEDEKRALRKRSNNNSYHTHKIDIHNTSLYTGVTRELGYEQDEHMAEYMYQTKEHYADKIIAIPEVVQREVHEEAFVAVARKVVEREKIIIVKETIEIPEIEYVDEYVTEEYVQDVHRKIEKPITVEVEVEHIVHVDDLETVLVEVPEVTYDDVVVVKDVEVPTIVEKEVIVEKVVPQIREDIIENVNYVYQDREVKRNIPVPVEALIKQKFIAPRIEPVYKDRSYNVLLPEFSEHAVWSSCLTPEGKAMLPSFNHRINLLAGASLCEIEKLFCDIRATPLETTNWLQGNNLAAQKMNIPYMGVERVTYADPVFMDGTTSLITTAAKAATGAAAKSSKFNPFSKKAATPAADTTGTYTNAAGATVPVATPQKFIQVNSGHGYTTMNPEVHYTKKTMSPVQKVANAAVTAAAY